MRSFNLMYIYAARAFACMYVRAIILSRSSIDPQLEIKIAYGCMYTYICMPGGFAIQLCGRAYMALVVLAGKRV